MAQLRPLPEQPYSFGQWKTARVNIDYHIAANRVFYSVPYTFVRKQVDVRLSEHVVEIFHKGQRIASHPRCHRAGSFLTTAAHMPKAHQSYQEWTPQRLVHWAEETGGATADVVNTIMSTRAHPQQGFRSCLGIMSLSRRFGPERLEAACVRALLIGSPGYKNFLSILEKSSTKYRRYPVRHSSRLRRTTTIAAHPVTVARRRGHQVCYGSPVSGDNDGLTSFNFVKKMREAGLDLRRLYFTHNFFN